MGDLLSHFGQAVRRQRELLRVSQEELADRAGVDRTYLSGIERGIRNPTLKTIDRLSRSLGVEMEVLFASVGEIRRGSEPREN
ncbi:helix-turn-helix domain-containing protein [Corallococcus sp. 4LFB]|uniref:helix-turn-helix domain-containing protein n=1 Tax=Corallococcus sp. 4LFB TaxID=3383249 RepID=UPI003976CD86